MSVKHQIREFLAENFYAAEAESITDDQSLVQTGLLDSTGVLELALYLEETFGIQVEDEDLLPENLDSLSRIEDFVNGKRSAGGQSAKPSD